MSHLYFNDKGYLCSELDACEYLLEAYEITLSDLAKILTGYEDVYHGNLIDEQMGICFNVDRVLGEDSAVVYELTAQVAATWEGSRHPGLVSRSPCSTKSFACPGGMSERQDLLRHIIQTLEELIDEQRAIS